MSQKVYKSVQKRGKVQLHITSKQCHTHAHSKMIFACTLHNCYKGRFTNCVDKILAFFDHLPPCIDIFYGMNVDKKWTFLDHLPTLYCKRSLWSTPYSTYNQKKILFFLFINCNDQVSIKIPTISHLQKVFVHAKSDNRTVWPGQFKTCRTYIFTNPYLKPSLKIGTAKRHLLELSWPTYLETTAYIIFF